MSHWSVDLDIYILWFLSVSLGSYYYSEIVIHIRSTSSHLCVLQHTHRPNSKRLEALRALADFQSLLFRHSFGVDRFGHRFVSYVCNCVFGTFRIQAWIGCMLVASHSLALAGAVAGFFQRDPREARRWIHLGRFLAGSARKDTGLHVSSVFDFTCNVRFTCLYWL